MKGKSTQERVKAWVQQDNEGDPFRVHVGVWRGPSVAAMPLECVDDPEEHFINGAKFETIGEALSFLRDEVNPKIEAYVQHQCLVQDGQVIEFDEGLEVMVEESNPVLH